SRSYAQAVPCSPAPSTSIRIYAFTPIVRVFCLPNLPFCLGRRYPANAQASATIATILLVNSTLDTSDDASGWRARLIEDSENIRRILAETKRVAVLGIKIDESQPAYYVPEYAKQA